MITIQGTQCATKTTMLLALLLAMTMLVGMLAVPSANVAGAGTLTAGDDFVGTITEPVDPSVDGYVINGNGTVKIDGLVLSPSGSAAINIIGSVTLELVGDSDLTGGSGYAAISVNTGNSLTIIGNGTLTVFGNGGGAGIGGDKDTDSGTITISGGTINVIGNGGGAGIGGGIHGKGIVNVTGGTIVGRSYGAWGKVGSVIGSGSYDSYEKGIVECNHAFNGVVTISGGTIKIDARGAPSGLHNCGTIGAGQHTGAKITISGGNIDIKNGNIGNYYGTSDHGTVHAYNEIDISGGNISVFTYYNESDPDNVNAPTQSLTAAIGGAMGTDVKITISGGTITNAVAVTCTGSGSKYYQGAAGIGSGYYGVAQITISGGTISNAQGASSAPGIGDASLPTLAEGCNRVIKNNESYVKITGGDITATGGIYAPGIGAGRGCEYVNVSISNANVLAIGGDCWDSDSYQTGAVGIGIGSTSIDDKLSGFNQDKYYREPVSVMVDIKPSAEVVAVSGKDAVGVVGDDVSSSFQYTIGGVTVTMSEEDVNSMIAGNTVSVILPHNLSTSGTISIVSVIGGGSGYHISKSISYSNGTGSFSETVGGKTYAVVFESEYLLSFSAENADITATVGGSQILSGTYVPFGTNVVFTITPEYGYDITVTGATLNGDGRYVAVVNGNTPITVTSTERYVSIGYSASTGGSVSVRNESVHIVTGSASGSTATAGNGFVFSKWIDEYGNIVCNTANFSPDKTGGENVAATYTAVFDIVPFIPTGDGYTIEHTGSTTVEYGGSYKFSVNIADNYNADDLVVSANGTPLVAVDGIYTVANIRDAVNITVSGLVELFEVTATLPGCAVIDNDETIIKIGDSYQFSVNIADNFSADDMVVSANGIPLVAVDGIYTIDNIHDAVNITVSGLVELFEVTATLPESVVIDNDETIVKIGDSYQFSVNIADNFSADDMVVSVNGTPLVAVDGIYTIEDIRDAVNITVSGLVELFDVIPTLPESVAIDNDETVVKGGSTYIANVAVEDGYTIDSVIVYMGGVVVENAYANGIITIENVSGTITVDVTAHQNVVGASLDWSMIVVVVGIVLFLFFLILFKRRKDEEEEYQ